MNKARCQIRCPRQYKGCEASCDQDFALWRWNYDLWCAEEDARAELKVCRAKLDLAITKREQLLAKFGKRIRKSMLSSV